MQSSNFNHPTHINTKAPFTLNVSTLFDAHQRVKSN